MNSRKKILIVIPDLSKGGAQNVAAMLSRHWQADNDVIMCLFDDDTISYQYGGVLLDLNCAPRNTIIGKTANRLTRIVKLVMLLKREKPDYIISFLHGSNVPVIISAFLSGMTGKCNLSIRQNPNAFGLLSKVEILTLFRLSHRISINSEKGRDILEHSFMLPSDRLTFIPNPVDTKRIDFLKEQNDITYWGNNDEVVLACGRLAYQKGFDFLIKAFRIVADQRRTKLFIFGNGKYRGMLEKLINSLGLTEQVYLPGVVDNIFVQMKRADVFVLSSRYEGWPNVLLEAMYVGLPVISTNCDTGPSEILDNGIYGRLVTFGDTKELSDNILDLLANKERIKRCTGNARMRASTFRVNEISKRWFTNY